MIEKKIKENGEHFCILVCYFFNQDETGLNAGLDGKIKTSVNIDFSQSNS